MVVLERKVPIHRGLTEATNFLRFTTIEGVSELRWHDVEASIRKRVLRNYTTGYLNTMQGMVHDLTYFIHRAFEFPFRLATICPSANSMVLYVPPSLQKTMLTSIQTEFEGLVALQGDKTQVRVDSTIGAIRVGPVVTPAVIMRTRQLLKGWHEFREEAIELVSSDFTIRTTYRSE